MGAYAAAVMAANDEEFCAEAGALLAGLAARGEWITNDKTLLDRAGLRGADDILVGLTAAPESLAEAVARATELVNDRGSPGPGR